MHVAGRALSIRDNNTGSTSPSRFTIGTFITRGLSSATKRGQLTGDLGRLHVDICCPLETKSPGGFDARSGNCLLLGQQSQPRHYGLVFDVATWGPGTPPGKAVQQWPFGSVAMAICTCLRHHQILSDVWWRSNMHCSYQKRVIR